MQSIIKANVERFKLLLSTETDPTKWAMEIRLLAEEEEKLVKMPKPEKKEDSKFLNCSGFRLFIAGQFVSAYHDYFQRCQGAVRLGYPGGRAHEDALLVPGLGNPRGKLFG